MTYLLLTIFFSSSMTFVMKHSETNGGNRYAVTMFNYLTGTVVSYALLEDKTLFFQTAGGKLALGLALLNAVLFVSCLLLIQYSIKKNGAPLTATFNRLGILIPTIISIFLFKEIPRPIQIAGLIFAVFAIAFINRDINEDKGTGSAVVLIMLFTIGGCIDLTSKVFTIYGNKALQGHFIFYTFIFSLLMSSSLLLLRNKNISMADIYSGILIGVPNQLIALFLLKAVAALPAFIVFPAYSAGVILTVNAVNLLVFKERLSRRQYIGTGIIALALVFINL